MIAVKVKFIQVLKVIREKMIINKNNKLIKILKQTMQNK
jgi:hypothetical protein